MMPARDARGFGFMVFPENGLGTGKWEVESSSQLTVSTATHQTNSRLGKRTPRHRDYDSWIRGLRLPSQVAGRCQ